MSSDLRRERYGVLALLFLCLPLAAQEERRDTSPYLLLTGIDGLRWDIIDRHPVRYLRRLASQGLKATPPAATRST